MDFIEVLSLLEKNTGIKRETIATITITISTFFLGFIINELIKGIKNFNDRKFNRKILQLNIKLLLAKLTLQIEGFNTFIEALTIDHDSSKSIRHIAFAPTDVLFTIGYDNLYKSQFSGIENLIGRNNEEKIKNFNNLWSIIYYFKHYHPKQQENAIEIVEEIGKLNELWNLSIQKAQNLIESFLLSLNGKPHEDGISAFWIGRNEIFEKFCANEHPSMPIVVYEYFKEILAHSVQNIDINAQFEDRIRSIETNDALNTSLNRYESLNNYIQASKATFEFNRDAYVSYQSELQKLANS